MKWAKGQSGNPNGRPAKPINTDLVAALKKEGVKRNKEFFAHVAALAYEDTTVALAVLNKLVPNLKQVDTTLEGDIGGEITITWAQP